MEEHSTLGDHTNYEGKTPKPLQHLIRGSVLKNMHSVDTGSVYWHQSNIMIQFACISIHCIKSIKTVSIQYKIKNRFFVNHVTWVDFNCFIINTIWDKGVIISERTFPINKNSIWHSKIFPSIKNLPQSLHLKRKRLEITQNFNLYPAPIGIFLL